MQLVSFCVLPVLFSSIQARVLASSTDGNVEISARQITAADSTGSGSDKCIISIEVGDCDTYQTCTKSVKVTGDCSREKQQTLKPIHCSFDLPLRMPGEKDNGDGSGVRCFPSPRRDDAYLPIDEGSTSKERDYSVVTTEHPLPPDIDRTRPRCANTPVPKFPEQTCKPGDYQCYPEIWYYVPPGCKPDPKIPELCQPIPKSECDQAPDKCDPIPLPRKESDKKNDCVPETWYYISPNCIPDAKIPKKCAPIPRSQCEEAVDQCDPLPRARPFPLPTVKDTEITPIEEPPIGQEQAPGSHPQDNGDFSAEEAARSKEHPDLCKPSVEASSTSSDGDKTYEWAWASSSDMPYPPRRGDTYPPGPDPTTGSAAD